MPSRLGATDNQGSLIAMHSSWGKNGFDNKARFGLLRKSVSYISEVEQHVKL